jgi:hypothetical protein
VPGEAYSPGFFIAPDAQLNLPGLGDDFPLRSGNDLFIGRVVKIERGLLTIRFDSPVAKRSLAKRLDTHIYPTISLGDHSHNDDGMVAHSLSILDGQPTPFRNDDEEDLYFDF